MPVIFKQQDNYHLPVMATTIYCVCENSMKQLEIQSEYRENLEQSRLKKIRHATRWVPHRVKTGIVFRYPILVLVARLIKAAQIYDLFFTKVKMSTADFSSKYQCALYKELPVLLFPFPWRRYRWQCDRIICKPTIQGCILKHDICTIFNVPEELQHCSIIVGAYHENTIQFDLQLIIKNCFAFLLRSVLFQPFHEGRLSCTNYSTKDVQCIAQCLDNNSNKASLT